MEDLLGISGILIPCWMCIYYGIKEAFADRRRQALHRRLGK